MTGAQIEAAAVDAMVPPLREQLEIPCADPGFTDELAQWASVIASRVTGSSEVADSALANAAIAVAWAAAAGISVLATTDGAPGGVREVVAGLKVPRVSDRMLDRAKAGLVRAVVDARLSARIAAAVLDQSAAAAGLVMVRAVDAPDRRPRRAPRRSGGSR